MNVNNFQDECSNQIDENLFVWLQKQENREQNVWQTTWAKKNALYYTIDVI